MGKKDDPETWKNAQDWDSGLQNFGAEVVRQNGSHRIYKFVCKLGTFFFLIAIHPGDIPFPIRRKLVKTMRSAGMISILLWTFWPHIQPLVKLIGL